MDSATLEVWHAASSSDDPGQLESTCQQWLDEEDRRRAEVFVKATSRNQHVVGRGMARRLLSGDQVEPQAIRFAVESHGKPYVVEPEAVRRPFNLAHTDGLVLCGIGNHHHRLVGVDVERLDRRTDPSLADRYFSPPEIELIHRCPNDADRRVTFLKIWTLKEAFIKAIGTGLQTPLADFTFRSVDSDTPSIELLDPKLDQGHRWQFFSFRPRPGFIAAIAVAPNDLQTDVQIELRRFDDSLVP